MKKRIILIVLVLAAAAVAVYAFRGTGRTPDNHLVVSGNIELTEVNIAFKTAGRLIERTVDEGDRVTRGQVIARLDRDQLVAQQSRESAGLQSSESQFAQAKTIGDLTRVQPAAQVEEPFEFPEWNRSRPAELLRRIALPHMLNLRNMFGETVNLGELQHEKVPA